MLLISRPFVGFEPVLRYLVSNNGRGDMIILDKAVVKRPSDENGCAERGSPSLPSPLLSQDVGASVNSCNLEKAFLPKLWIESAQ